ncbi:hypothetical protein GCM10009706_27510 [Curtobacterium citreum]|uniref:Uncharacterized protein n=1 Tax=Curtobacterium citreum TaxID=2036 RepID=A0ABT2HKF5_9MICO|nr:hypothetical protein [Curtobacterium citreum]MCS6523758.1 hypothetical protein [Curtobacterium citreum]TQJ26451.1 hypothetical protein FB462_0285 [Curtobacterium citreum]GGL87445.1 hypothetical protein GCM10009706_27510 [Curtobacterium citreum]
MRGAATDLSARLWDERALLGQLRDAVDDPARSVVLDRLGEVRLERDVLVHAVAEQWGAPGRDHTLPALLDVAPVPWNLLLPDHLAAITALHDEVDAVLPPGPVRERWDRVTAR